jgi:hypothetical protein
MCPVWASESTTPPKSPDEFKFFVLILGQLPVAKILSMQSQDTIGPRATLDEQTMKPNSQNLATKRNHPAPPDQFFENPTHIRNPTSNRYHTPRVCQISDA